MAEYRALLWEELHSSRCCFGNFYTVYGQEKPLFGIWPMNMIVFTVKHVTRNEWNWVSCTCSRGFYLISWTSKCIWSPSSYELLSHVSHCIHVQGPNAYRKFFLPMDDMAKYIRISTNALFDRNWLYLSQVLGRLCVVTHHDSCDLLCNTLLRFFSFNVEIGELFLRSRCIFALSRCTSPGVAV